MNIFRLPIKSEKNRIILVNLVGAFGIKGLSLILSLFTMPVYMRYFSDQQILGVWFTVLSVLTWILNFDLGIGNGLRNKLTIAFAVGNKEEARKYIASAYWLIGAIILVLTLLGGMVIPLINWNEVFNVDKVLISSETLSQVVTFVFIAIVLQFQLRLISSVLYALQKSALNNLISLLTSVLQLAIALTAPAHAAEENLKFFSIAYIFSSNFPLILATVLVFAGPLKQCRPNIKSFEFAKARSVLSLGSIFFFCQIAYMIIANTNEFFITQYTNAGNVVEYQIYNKFFTLGSTLFVLALTPVWSAVSKATAEKDYVWIKKLNKTLLRLSVVAGIGEFLVIPFLQFAIDIWLGENSIQVNYSYAVCFALYGSIMIMQSAISTITNGLGRMKIQAVCYGIGIVGKILLIDIGVSITGSWIVVVIANAVTLIPYCIIQQIDLNRYLADDQNYCAK